MDDLKIPDSVREIEEEAFYIADIRCVIIGKGITHISRRAFCGASIEDLILPDTIISIGEEAFCVCYELLRVYLPSSVKNIEKGVEKLGLDLFEGCTSLEKVEIPETVYEIEDLGLREGCTVYGLSGSYAENYCKMNQIPFVSTGKTQIQTPKATANIVAGNTIRAELNKGYTNAEFYDYVLTKDKNFPKTGRYLYRQNSSKESRQDFECMDKGTYYLFVRSGRKTDDGKIEYSSWSEGVKAAVTIQTPKAPKIQKVTVKENTVAVTVSKVPEAKGYGIVLSKGRTKNGCQKLLKPASIVYASKNNKSVIYVFKDVNRKGQYCVLARTYTKDTNNKNVYSRWSGYSKMIQVK